MAKQEHHSFIVVGIGASAGGLQVLKEIVKSIPQDSGMAFVIVQHLDPTHKSMLVELLEKESNVAISEAKDGIKLASDHIYVIPPNAYLELDGRKIILTQPPQERGARKAIDHFFRSMAREWGDRCAGIVLSGSGSDGTAGLRSIKAAGGLSLVQTPETAEHSSMPQSAIYAEVVDKVCEVSDMYFFLDRYANYPAFQIGDYKNETKKENESAEDSLEEIVAILKIHEDFNLNQYKPSTVQRRIARRMSLTNTGSYEDYLQMLRDEHRERKRLTKDLLINVTDFFRDAEAYKIIEENVIPDILKNIGKEEEIRVWVAGCASGEEAYSLAILLKEGVNRSRKTNPIKIFATDVNEHAIKIARKGLYPDTIVSEVPKKYLDKYFIKSENDHYYQIRNQVRDLISFAVQNVAVDPPFNRMHLISCRNLLIYFNRDVQQKVLSSLFFSLHDHHYLFLGSSESLGKKAELFKTASKKWRIYQKLPGRNRHKMLMEYLHVSKTNGTQSGKNREKQEVSGKQEKALSRAEMIRQAILSSVIPSTVVVDEEGQILYSHGNLQPYFIWPEGEPSNTITQLVKPELKSRVRSALYKVRKSLTPVTFRCNLNPDRDEETNSLVKVEVIPITEQDFVDGDAFSIVFNRENTVSTTYEETLSRDDEYKAQVDLERELAETRQELQNTVEQLETSTEELKASHEESLSTNEELQSSNEELEASSEELRSLNEELSTVNAQLKEKIRALQRANDDLENFFSSTDVPTIFLDDQLKIQRYTPAAEQLLKMGPGDLDREISALGRDLLEDDLLEECEEVLRNFQPRRKKIQTFRGEWFIRQVSPYRTLDRRIEGVVLVFQNITELKELSNRAEGREKQQAVVAQLGMLALGGTDPEELMQQAVREVAHVLEVDFCKILKYQPEEKNFLLTTGVGWKEGMVGQALVPDDQGSQAGYTLISGEPVIVKNLKEEKRFSGPDLLFEHKIVSGISCLINHSDPPYGILSIHTLKQRHFTQDDANFLVSVANMLSTALHARTAQKQVFESEEKFRTIANSIPQLAWMTDKTGYIFWYNQRWYDFTGTNPEEMKGWGWQKVHHPDHVERVVNTVKHCFEAGKEWEDIFPLRSKEGEYRWFLSRAMPIHDTHGNISQWFGTNTDITERLEQERALKSSEDRLRLAKDSAKLGLFEYDIRNNQVDWEPMLYRVWGLNTEETVTLEKFYGGLHPDDVEKTRKAVDAALDPAGDGHYEVTYRVINQINQQTYWIKASGVVLFEENEAARMIGLVNDVTEQKMLESSLKAAKEEAESAAQAKNEFLSIMSHEIRTPMNAIIGLSNLLLKSDARPEQEEKLKTLKFSSESLLNLVNDILDYSRLEAGKVELEKIHYDLSDLINGIYQSHKYLTSQKGNHLFCIIDDKIPQVLQGDPLKLSQILNNLLSNANKFTHEGDITLKVILEAQQNDHAKLQFRVEDKGVGIPPEKQDVIFEKFSQADSSTVRQYGGSGLGLNIIKILLQLMGSEIKLESEEGKGSVFYFYLDQPIGDPDNLLEKELVLASNDHGKLKNMRLLLVEDAEVNRMVLQQHLQEWWHLTAEEAVNGLEAVEKTASKRYDLILMDIRMPKMDGVEASRRIRQQNEYNARLPIIALTADTQLSDLTKDEKGLFNKIITKPFDPEKLLQTIISLQAVNEAETDNADQQSNDASEQVINYDKLKATFVKDEVVIEFLKKAENSINEFRSHYFSGMREHEKQKVSDALHKAKLLFDLLDRNELYDQMSEARRFMTSGNKQHSSLEAELESIEVDLDEIQSYIAERIESYGNQ